MKKFSAHQVLNGTWGEVWIDGTLNKVSVNMMLESLIVRYRLNLL